ncbi:CdaR family transcriptional regulator [Nocardia sp. CNY236]|uniref:PucR family transcriptional regulator n=1 Tax=Nocardia sp. CNY236 TaxID=1169152 RepID=UPI0003FD8E45|nr:PucR family transcriptional regulator [Nocardia sp. CNY236]
MSVALSPIAGGSPLVTRLLAQWPQIAERMFVAGLGTTPPAADLPDGHFTAEVLPAIYACGRAVLQAMADQRRFTKAEVATFVAPVAERHAEDRFPLPVLIEAIHGSAQSVLQEAAAVATRDELDDLVLLGRHLLDLLMQVNIIVVETYTEVEQSIYNAEREARRALCSALLHGAAASELAARADTTLAERYTILAIHIQPNDQPSTVATLVGRRRIRILQRALDTLAGTTALATFDGWTGTALLPSPGAADHDHAQSTHAQLTAELTERFGVPVFIAEFPSVLRSDIPEIAHEAAELAELARLLGRPAGAYHLDDLLLEHQLTQPGIARDRLARLISPILDSPHLLEALDAHLRHGSDRKTAAAEIHVHPNTFSYRLRRIAELTGVDPTDPHDSRLLAAALTIQRLHPDQPTTALGHAQPAESTRSNPRY